MADCSAFHLGELVCKAVWASDGLKPRIKRVGDNEFYVVVDIRVQ